jgi:hypothetical protein
MDPLSIVGMVASAVSLCSAVISTLYDIDHTRIPYTESSAELAQVIRSVGELEKSLGIQKDTLERLLDQPETCRRIVSLRSDALSKCRQIVESKQSRKHMPQGDDLGGWQDTGNLDEICTKLMTCVRSHRIRAEPMLWRLQRRIMVSIRYVRYSRLFSCFLSFLPSSCLFSF